MYSNFRSVQILIALMKEHNIKDVVLSPGGSDIPLIHSIETDEFFECYSVVDERSAAYFAMGLAQSKRRTVACVCTSGSAVCNYLPGITEAFYQSVPVLAITADKNPYYQGQLETQKIEQTHIFDGVVKKAVNLPLINSAEDEWLCNRLVNEALLKLNHHGKGPVHVNIPIVGATDIYDCAKLPNERCVKIIDLHEDRDVWKNQAERLAKAKRVLVVVGQNVEFSEKLIQRMDEFFEKINCIYAVEHLSNLECKGCVYTYPLTEMSSGTAMKDLKPDVVISIGNNLSAYCLKPYLRAHYKEMENWLISESGEVRDAYKCLSQIFECTVDEFFERILSEIEQSSKNDEEYYNAWQSALNSLVMPELPFSNFYVAQQVAKVIPKNSILHLAILNSTRVMQFFPLAEGVRTYSNVGTLGIDGCFSSFAGQAAGTEELAFLVIGDLSFFYDMNAAGLRSISNNVRVILLNNGGGSEFHFFMGKDRISTIDDYICAEHHKKAAGWIQSLGWKYFAATSKEEFDNAIEVFGQPSDGPMLLEVFAEMEEEAIKTRTMYAANHHSTSTGIKNMMKSVLSDKQISKAKKIISAIKE